MGYSHTSQINYRMYLFTSEHVTILRCTWHWPTRCREAQWCRQPCTVPPTWPKTENQKPQWTAKSEKKNVRKYDLIIVITCYCYSHWYIYIYTHVSDSLFASIFWGRWELFPKSKLGRGFPAALPPASLASTIRVRSHLNDHCFGKNQDFIVLFEHQKMMGAVERKVSEKNDGKKCWAGSDPMWKMVVEVPSFENRLAMDKKRDKNIQKTSIYIQWLHIQLRIVELFLKHWGIPSRHSGEFRFPWCWLHMVRYPILLVIEPWFPHHLPSQKKL